LLAARMFILLSHFYFRCIIKLGTPGTIFGFDVDTSHFSGNEAPEVSVEALFSEEDPTDRDARVCPTPFSPGLTERTGHIQWSEILPRVPLGPNSRHLFKVPETKGVNYVKLNMYPDGGIVKTSFFVHGLGTEHHPGTLPCLWTGRSCVSLVALRAFRPGTCVFGGTSGRRLRPALWSR
jgi:allantoicase